MSQYRMPIIRLYRTIMKTHKKKLPFEMRQLGDTYVRSEFRSIQKAKTDQQVQIFINQWELYLNALDRQRDVVGIKMKKQVIDKLDVEQQHQLRKLKEAAYESAAGSGGNAKIPE